MLKSLILLWKIVPLSKHQDLSKKNFDPAKHVFNFCYVSIYSNFVLHYTKALSYLAAAQKLRQNKSKNCYLYFTVGTADKLFGF